MRVVVCDSETPLDDQTKSWTVYVPDPRFRTGDAVPDAPAASVILDVDTSTVCPAESLTTAKTITDCEVAA